MNWLLRKIKERDVRENLVRVLAERNADENSEQRLRAEVSELTTENAYGLLAIITNDLKYRTDIAIGIRRMKRKYFDWNSRMSTVIEYFDFALGLGIEYPLDIIDSALGDMDNVQTTPEQDKALIRLEDARWKQPTTTPGKRSRYPSFVIDAVLSNPQGIDRIIAVVSNNNVEREPQFKALLDGTVVPALSEGVL